MQVRALLYSRRSARHRSTRSPYVAGRVLSQVSSMPDTVPVHMLVYEWCSSESMLDYVGLA